jgi:hypothetical protein
MKDCDFWPRTLEEHAASDVSRVVCIDPRMSMSAVGLALVITPHPSGLGAQAGLGRIANREETGIE